MLEGRRWCKAEGPTLMEGNVEDSVHGGDGRGQSLVSLSFFFDSTREHEILVP